MSDSLPQRMREAAKVLREISARDDAWVDEIPDAYKDIDTVLADAEPLVEVVHELRQLLNVKGE